MTTPTPMKHAPSQQGRTPNALGSAPTPRTIAAATPPVSTPFSAMHAAFSPPPVGYGPRSSPQQFKKSPANSGTLLGHPNNAPVSYDSPAAAAAFGQQLGMGDLGLDGVATPAASTMGAAMGPMPPQRSEEDDRLRRLTKVMGMLEPHKGRVSEAGLARLVRRTGLDDMWDTTNVSGAPTRTLIIAGKAVSVDIVCSNNLILSVALEFPGADDVVNKHAEQANKILLANLQLQSGQSPLTKTLGNFAANLERLAVLDKLCVLPELNCHEAIAGVYSSLEKLYKWDVERAVASEPQRSRHAAEMETLCARHGRPLMHSRSRLGVSVDYWKERWMVPPQNTWDREDPSKEGKVFSLVIGCTKSDGRLSAQGLAYPAVRVSKSWISETVEKVDPTPEETLMASGPIIDWQEPDSTLLRNPTGEAKENETAQDILMAGGNFPEVIFTATFDPPLVVPLHHVQTLFSLVDEPFEQRVDHETYDNLLFPLPPGTIHDDSAPRQLRETRNFAAPGKVGADGSNAGQQKPVRQRHTLFINKRIYGQVLKELPFAHPKQIVTMMPILRQYAMLTTLLQVSFGDEGKDKQTPAIGNENSESAKTDMYGPPPAHSLGDEFDTFMTDTREETIDEDGDVLIIYTSGKPLDQNATNPEGHPEEPEPDLSVDMTLFLHPAPAIKVEFPFRDGIGADITVDVGPDGVIGIQSQNLVPQGSEEHRRMERALQVLCDIGMWVSWIREEL